MEPVPLAVHVKAALGPAVQYSLAGCVVIEGGKHELELLSDLTSDPIRLLRQRTTWSYNENAARHQRSASRKQLGTTTYNRRKEGPARSLRKNAWPDETIKLQTRNLECGVPLFAFRG